MTSRRRVLERTSTDELGKIIGCALEDRIAGARPDTHVWGRIKHMVERTAVRDRMGMRLALPRISLRRTAMRSRMDAFLSAQVVSLAWPERRAEWWRSPGDTRLVDQYGAMLQLAF
jgi:hypothetical protein